ncbi:MAG: ClpXP protease specificity-enhancing factor SspB, partial [Stellaceae bacterium]
MPQDLFHYDKMVERALRGVIRDVLARVAQEGLRSNHHFYIGFATTAPGVVIPPRLLERFPSEITIVLQHQFWDLDVGDETFSVSLSFDKQVERLSVPFVAVKSFADPSVEFALAFA